VIHQPNAAQSKKIYTAMVPLIENGTIVAVLPMVFPK
jgi:hypothetical protein